MSDSETFITSAEVRRYLEPLGFDPGQRRLRDWRRRGALPELARRSRGIGQGAGSVQGWTDPDIDLQICSLLVAESQRARLDWMKLAAWFVGFDYPVEQMRPAWIWLCQRRGPDAAARELHVGFISDEDRPGAAERIFWGLPDKDRRPAVLAMLQAKLDPTFTELTWRQLDDVRKWLSDWQPETNFATPPLDTIVQTTFAIQRVFGPTGLEAVLRDASDDQIADAHQDARFLVTPLRLVAGLLIEFCDGPALETILNLLVRIGSPLHALALVLRYHGHGDRIEATKAQLQVFASNPAVQDAFEELVLHMGRHIFAPSESVTTTRLPSLEVPEFREDFASAPELWAAFKAAVPAVTNIWADLTRPIVDALLDVLETRPVSGS